MEKRQNTIKYRLLACVVAVALAIGLSAMPALAEPSEEAGGSISIVSVDTSAENAADKTEAADKKEPAKSDAASTKSEAPAKSESVNKKPVSTDVLSPAEKLGAVLEGEGQAAVSNATGISAQATEEEGELSEKEQAKEAIIAAVRTGAQATATYYGDLQIDKFITGPLYTVQDQNGNAVPAEYTVMFEIEGKDDAGNVVYTKRTLGLKVSVSGQATASNSIKLNHLPAGIYTVTEIEYPGCGYTCTSAKSLTQEIVKGSTVEATSGSDKSWTSSETLKFSFTNQGESPNYPNQGFVNHYRDHDGNFGWTKATRD